MTRKQRRDDELLIGAVKDAMVLPQVLFVPTPEQRELKAKFWLEFLANPIIDNTDISPLVVEEYLGRPISAWMKQPNFWQWFKSRDMTKRYLEIAAEKACELAIMYLDPAIPMQDSARVNLMKIVLEFAGRTPPVRKEIKWQDQDVASLDDQQLDALIAKLSRKAAKNLEPKE